MANLEVQARRHLTIICYLLVGVQVLTVLYLLSGLTGPGRFYRSGVPVGADFLQIWAGSSLAKQGHPAAVYDTAALKKAEIAIIGGDFREELPWHYPPTFLMLALPLSSLHYFAALAAWLFLPLAGMLLVLYKIFPDRLIVWLALANLATSMNLLFGQGAFLVTLLMGGGLLLLESRPLLAGVLFSLLLNYKPHLGLLIPVALLAGRHWRALGALAAASAVLMLASVWVLGMDTWRAFGHDLHRMREQLTYAADLYDRMPTVFGALRLLGGSDLGAKTLQLLAALWAAAGVCWIWQGPSSLARRGAVLVVGTLLLTPHALYYDLTLLLLPLAWIARESFGQPNWGRLEVYVLLAIWFSPFLELIAVKLASVHLVPLLLAGLLLYLLKRPLTPGVEKPLAPS